MVEHIRPNHRNFVDNQDLHFFVQTDIAPFFNFVRRKKLCGKTKKRVYRLPLHIERGNARRGENNAFFARCVLKKMEQRRFTRSCTTRDKEVFRCFFKRVESKLEIVVEFEWLFQYFM